LFDLLALLGQSLVLMAGRVENVLGVCKTHRRFGRTTWAAFCRLIACVLLTGLGLIKLLLCLGERLECGSLFGGQRCANGGAELMLDMEQVRGVMGTELVFAIGHNTGGLVPGGLHHLTVQLGQSRCHQVMPGVLIPGLSELFQNNKVAHRIAGHQANAASPDLDTDQMQA
jgi:hypothetical protein